MSDLIAFIEARLAEDEAHARKDLWITERATPLERWTTSYGYNLPYSLLGEDGSIGRLVSTSGGPPSDGAKDLHYFDALLVGRLVRRADRHARRVLREVEAKRRILAMHQHEHAKFADEYPEDERHPSLIGCLACHWSCEYEHVKPYGWCEHVRLMASVWSDHPDYRTDWSPA